MSNLWNSENFQIANCNRKICNLENSKKFPKCQKFSKFYNFENHQVSKIVQIWIKPHFQNFIIWKTKFLKFRIPNSKFQQISNLEDSKNF